MYNVRKIGLRLLATILLNSSNTVASQFFTLHYIYITLARMHASLNKYVVLKYKDYIRKISNFSHALN